MNLGETMTAIRKLARFIVGFHLSDAPDSVLNATKRCIQDTIGVAIGASLSGGIRNVIQKSLADAPVECGASLWGLLEKLSPSSAALYNAMMAHYLELDDVHPTSKTLILLNSLLSNSITAFPRIGGGDPVIEIVCI